MIQAAALQLKLENKEKYVEDLTRFSDGLKVDLLVLPPLAGLLFENSMEYLTFHEAFSKTGKFVLVPGSFREGGYHKAMIMYRGDIIHTQCQTHLSRRDEKEGQIRGNDLDVVDTPIGKVFLSVRFRTGPLKKHISGIKPAVCSKPKTPLKVSALQVEFMLHKTPAEYFEHMKSLAERAVREGAAFVAYPENIHLSLYGLLPGIEKSFSSDSPASRNGGNMRDALMTVGPYLKGIYFETFSSIARLYGIYVMGGSITVPENGELYNIACLFGPDGKEIGRQKKLHITPEEEAFGLKPGGELKVCDLPFGTVAFPVCMDATYYETFEIARKKGADMVVIPIANMEEYDFYRALRGIWPRVQESRVIGIKSALVGKVAKYDFTGRAGIFAPIDLTPNRDGILKISENHYGDDVITAEVDIEALRRYRERDELLWDRNEALYRKYFSRLYV